MLTCNNLKSVLGFHLFSFTASMNRRHQLHRQAMVHSAQCLLHGTGCTWIWTDIKGSALDFSLVLNQLTRESCGCPKFLSGKVFGQISTLLENSSTTFPAAQNAMPAKVWALSGKENGCWEIGPAFGNAPEFSPPRPPHPLPMLHKREG